METMYMKVSQLEDTTKDLMGEIQNLMDNVMKDTMSMDYLARLDTEELEAFKSYGKIMDSCKTFMETYVGVLKGMDRRFDDIEKRQVNIQDLLKEINRKLDKK